jgi:hypothetical protein
MVTSVEVEGEHTTKENVEEQTDNDPQEQVEEDEEEKVGFRPVSSSKSDAEKIQDMEDKAQRIEDSIRKRHEMKQLNAVGGNNDKTPPSSPRRQQEKKKTKRDALDGLEGCGDCCGDCCSGCECVIL